MRQIMYLAVQVMPVGGSVLDGAGWCEHGWRRFDIIESQAHVAVGA